MLKLTVNGDVRQLPSPCNLTDALATLGYRGRFFAVAVSGRFVPREHYDRFRLAGGEQIEVLSPMQGG